MRLHSLRFAALGPFAGEEAIDFATLTQSGIFLFEGPTGSGKSSIIDAIVFALYGMIADGDKAKERMRSDFAAPRTESYVDLVFETNRGVFRVRRTPGYERAKQRGEGTTPQNPTAKLWRLSTADLDAVLDLNQPGAVRPHDELDARGELVSHRAAEVGAEVEQIVGLNRGQFVQTVVLPQGLFAQFLTAKPEDRTAILRRVFRTELYVNIEARLREQAKDQSSKLRDAEAQANGAIATLVRAMGDVSDSEFLTSKATALDELTVTTVLREDEPNLREVTASVQDHFAHELASARTSWEKARQDRKDADNVFERAKTTSSLAERRDTARTELAELEAVSGQINQLRDKLAASERATTVASAHQRHANAAKNVDKYAHALAAGRAAATQSGIELPEQLDDAALRQLRDTITKTDGELDAAQQAWGAVLELTRRSAKLESKLERSAAKRDTLTQKAHGLPDQLADLQRRIMQAANAETDLVRAQHAATATQAHLAATTGLTKTMQQWQEATDELGTAATTAANLVKDATDLQLARLANMSSELAQQLRDDEPCPVCGAHEHPHPAQPSSPAITPADVAAAEAKRDRAVALAETSRTTTTTLRQKCLSALESLRTEFPVAAELADSLVSVDAAADTDATAARMQDVDHDVPADAAAHVGLGRADAAGKLTSTESLFDTVTRLLEELIHAVTSRHAEATAATQRAQEAVTTLEQLRGDLQSLETRSKTIAEDQRQHEIAHAALTTEHREIAAQSSSATATARRLTTSVQRLLRVPVTADDHAATDRGDDSPTNIDKSPEVQPNTKTIDSDTVDYAVETTAAAALLTEYEQLLDDRDEALTELDDVWRQWKQALQSAENLRAVLAETTVAQGFASVDDALGALVPDADAVKLTKNVADHADRLARVNATLQLPEVVELPETIDIDLPTLSTRATEAAAMEAAAEGVHTAQVARTSTVSSAAISLLQAVDDYESRLDAGAALVRIAELVTGASTDNRIRMSLSTYVLVQRFEAVVDSANLRLENLSDGRYRLERTEERESSRDRRVGLALQVIDNETEKARPTRSLSGGETFYVSLCLALGLADVVMAESGARDFGTLIIDEGFGTLDSERLETVLKELAALRTGGRTIGVVSHVEALKTVIAEQIQVRPAPTHGSTVKVVC